MVAGVGRWWRHAERTLSARADGGDGRGRRDPRCRRTKAWSPATSSTLLPGCRPFAPTGECPGRRGHPPPREGGRHRVRGDRASRCSRERPAPSPRGARVGGAAEIAAPAPGGRATPGAVHRSLRASWRKLIDLFQATDVHRSPQPGSFGGRARRASPRAALSGSSSSPLAALADDVRRTVGRAPSYGDGINVQPPSREMVRASRPDGGGNADRVATRRRSSAPRSRSWVPDEAERQWIEPPPGIAAGGRARDLTIRARGALCRVAYASSSRSPTGRPRHAGLRGPAMGRSQPARLHRPSHGTWWAEPPHHGS